MSTKKSKLDVLNEVVDEGSHALESLFSNAEAVREEQKTGHAPSRKVPGDKSFPRETSDAVGQQIVPVPLELIDESPLNARKIYKSERVRDMAAALATEGQLQPGMAIKRGDRYMLIAGHYRFRGLKQAGKATMDLIIKDEGLSDQQIYKLSYSENKDRNAQGPLDDALAWRQLLSDGIYVSQRELAEAVGKKVAMVSKTLTLGTISAEAQRKIEESPESDAEGSPYADIAFTTLYAYAQLEAALRDKDMPLTVALDALDKALIGRITREQIDAIRHNIETGRSRKGKEMSQQYKVTGNAIGVIKEFRDSGRVQIDITITDEQEREALMDELRRRFKHEVVATPAD